MEIHEAIKIIEIFDGGKNRDKINKLKFATNLVSVSGDKGAIRRIMFNKVMDEIKTKSAMGQSNSQERRMQRLLSKEKY